MKLKLIRGWNSQEETISNDPDEYLIKKIMLSLNWENFNSVSLENNEMNLINVSGNIASEGLALIYQKEGELYVSKNSPQSINELSNVLISYLKGNKTLNENDFYSTKPKTSIQKDSPEYNAWNQRFEKQKVADKKKKLKVFIASSLVIFLLSSFSYLLITDELKFLFYNTKITEATITEIHWQRERWGALQHCIYEFQYNEIKYTGSFKGSRLIGKFLLDDIILVKFATSKPNISKRIDSR